MATGFVRHLRSRIGAVALVLFTCFLLASVLGIVPATADTAGSIDHVETDAGELRLLYSLPGLPDGTEPDAGSVSVMINDEQVEATAVSAEDAGTADPVRRTTILAIDVSNSMKGERFRRAQDAAKAFLSGAPDDVFIGVVAFAGQVTTVQAPTLDRAVLRGEIDKLALSPQTRLYDGVAEALGTTGDDGQRSVLVLSDGKDTSDTNLLSVTDSIKLSQVKVDVVALEQSGPAQRPLKEMVAAGGGSLFTADDPEALVRLFTEEAAALSRQVLITATVPEELAGTEGTLGVSIQGGTDTYTDTAFVTLKQAATGASTPIGPREVAAPTFPITPDLMWGGLAAAGLGLLLLLLNAFGVFTKREKQSLEDRVSAYSQQTHAASATSAGSRSKPAGHTGVAGSAVDVAQRALNISRGFEPALGARLVAAGLTLKPAEWLLMHAGIAVGAAVMGFMVSSGNPLGAVLCFIGGILLPWLYLGRKKGRRLKAFDGHLAETLQLISGSLSAGLSLAQSIDTVVREGTEPIAGEFRKALVEARLGVPIEDALDSVSTRMESGDFEWVVMAIRIQREVGGNLAELLLSVASTMREREYLRRQVKSLSAEGRLSAWILGGLPPVFVVYLMLTNPGYLQPLVESVLGWAMIAAMCALMAVGSFWMSRVVKVDV